MKKISFSDLCLCLILIFISSILDRVQHPQLVSNGMVLHRETEVKIWGWADEGEQVTIDFNAKTYATTTNA